MKKVVYVTGTRAEFGVMEGLLKRMQERGFGVSVIATGMHLSATHGRTFTEVERSGLPLLGVVDGKVDDTLVGMSASVGHEVIGITTLLAEAQPDLVIVAADRDEALAGAIAAAHLNIPIAHISGGDVSTGATIDERIRHAITKFSDIHFPANEESAKVVVSLGENPELVFPVGNPGVALSYAFPEEVTRVVKERYGIPEGHFALVTQHPVTSAVAEAGAQMNATLDALVELALPALIIYPNSDAGSSAIIDAIEARRNNSSFSIFKNIPRDDFKVLMSLAAVMVGNSSAALIEAPSFHLPAVNIGPRQEGRERGENVIDAPHEKQAIIDAIQKALSPEFLAQVQNAPNPYARENADEKIIEILESLDLGTVRGRKGTPHG